MAKQKKNAEKPLLCGEPIFILTKVQWQATEDATAAAALWGCNSDRAHAHRIAAHRKRNTPEYSTPHAYYPLYNIPR